MGYKDKRRELPSYCTIRDGEIIVPVKTPTTDSVPRTNKLGKEVHEEHKTGLSGLVTSVRWVEGDKYGNQWEIKMQDVVDNFLLRLPESGSNSWTLLNRLLNADTKRYLYIEPYSFIPKGKDKEMRGVILYYDGDEPMEKIPPYSTKDDPKGCPEMEKKEIKGKDVWDDFERIKWMKAQIEKKFPPKTRKENDDEVRKVLEDDTRDVPDYPFPEDDQDSLPF